MMVAAKSYALPFTCGALDEAVMICLEIEPCQLWRNKVTRLFESTEGKNVLLLY